MSSTNVGYRCYVGSLASFTGEQDLKKVFSQFGEIIDFEIIYDRVTGKSRGFGYVTYKEENSMRDAIEKMNRKELDGHSIIVIEAHQSRGSSSGGGPRVHGNGGFLEGDGYEEGDGRPGGSICGG